MKLLYFLIMLLCTISTRAQQPYKPKKSSSLSTRSIDLRDSTANYTDTFYFGHVYRYKLINVNKFVYKTADGTQSGTDFNSTPPSSFSSIKLPAFPGSIITSNPGNNFLEVTVSKAILDNYQKKNQWKPAINFDTTCECINGGNEILHHSDLTATYDSLKTQYALINTNFDIYNRLPNLSKDIESLKVDVADSWLTILARKTRLFNDSVHLNLHEQDTMMEITSFFKKLIGENKVIIQNELIPKTNKLINFLQPYADALENCLKDYYKKMECIKCDRHYDYYSHQYDAKKDCLDSLTALIHSLKKIVAASNEGLEKMWTLINDGTLAKMQTNYNSIVEENFEIILDDFIAKKDIHEITFNIAAESPLLNGIKQKRVIKVEAVTRRGWKIDYSTGVFANFGNQNFYGPVYYVETDENNNKTIRQATRKTPAMLSIGALTHISYRTGKIIKPGIALGVSTTSGFDAFNFHGGFSVIFGKPNQADRIILSLGVTLKESKLLDGRFSVGQTGPEIPTEIPTVGVFPRFGTFLAITYNLSGGSEKAK